jgi:hypothetical protein
MKLKHASWLALAAATAALIGVAIVGCGAAGDSTGEGASESPNTTVISSEYGELLLGFRNAAESNRTYDAYGFAEYIPATQRAAIDAFCFIADQLSKASEGESPEDPARLISRITRKSEADLKSERNIVAPGPARRDIEKLREVLGLKSVSHELAKRYAKACY